MEFLGQAPSALSVLDLAHQEMDIMTHLEVDPTWRCTPLGGGPPLGGRPLLEPLGFLLLLLLKLPPA